MIGKIRAAIASKFNAAIEFLDGPNIPPLDPLPPQRTKVWACEIGVCYHPECIAKREHQSGSFQGIDPKDIIYERKNPSPSWMYYVDTPVQEHAPNEIESVRERMLSYRPSEQEIEAAFFAWAKHLGLNEQEIEANRSNWSIAMSKALAAAQRIRREY